MRPTVRLCAARRWSAASRSSRKRTEVFVGGRTDELGLAQRKKKPAKCSNGPKCLNGLKKNPPQLLKEMTSSKAFRCVQAWLLEKPAAWADEDAPCLAAALMAQRPPNKRPRKDALLEAERSHQRRRIELLKEQLRASPCSRSRATILRARYVFPAPGRPVSNRELPAAQCSRGSSSLRHRHSASPPPCAAVRCAPAMTYTPPPERRVCRPGAAAWSAPPGSLAGSLAAPGAVGSPS